MGYPDLYIDKGLFYYLLTTLPSKWTIAVSFETRMQQKIFPNHLSSIFHGVLVGAGSLWLPRRNVVELSKLNSLGKKKESHRIVLTLKVLMYLNMSCN